MILGNAFLSFLIEKDSNRGLNFDNSFETINSNFVAESSIIFNSTKSFV
jgi:hypothetical protein